jgi:hypothetical protein
MESENIEETIQEGGTTLSPNDNFLVGMTSVTLSEVATIPLRTNDSLRTFTLPNLGRGGTTRYLDRPLLLSDLASLIVGGPVNASEKPGIQNLFDSIPLAQYKHLPAIRVLNIGAGGSIDETPLETHEDFSLSKEEDLPSLDIIEPSSIGGSYKRSSHKKRKSTRIRTKKNKNYKL